jgi:F-box-like
MHPCLQIPEIIRAIFSWLSQDDGGTLAALSLTCRNFYEPASDRLWSDLPSVVPLVRCLPDDLLEVETLQKKSHLGAVTVKSQLVSSEWPRYLIQCSSTGFYLFSSLKKRLSLLIGSGSMSALLALDPFLMIPVLFGVTQFIPLLTGKSFFALEPVGRSFQIFRLFFGRREMILYFPMLIYSSGSIWSSLRFTCQLDLPC